MSDAGSPPPRVRRVSIRFPMSATWKVGASIVLAAPVLVGCSPSSPVAVGHEQFRFTCCANSEALTHAWHPGQLITLQWSAESAGMTADDAQLPITLTATFTGPYASVAALKAGGTHAATLLAAPIRVTDRTSGGAVSTIALPLDLAAGWYDLVTTIRSARSSTGGATVIQVTRLNAWRGPTFVRVSQVHNCPVDSEVRAAARAGRRPSRLAGAWSASSGSARCTQRSRNDEHPRHSVASKEGTMARRSTGHRVGSRIP